MDPQHLRILSLGKFITHATSSCWLILTMLDGGGIRGLSSLLILENLMEGLREANGLDKVPRPCEWFDLIGGTSTGGSVDFLIMLWGVLPHLTNSMQNYCNYARKIRHDSRRLYQSVQEGCTASLHPQAVGDCPRKTKRRFLCHTARGCYQTDSPRVLLQFRVPGTKKAW